MPDEFAVSETSQPIAATTAETAAPKKRNTGLVIALGALAVLVVVGAVAAVLVLFVFQSSSDSGVEVRVPEGQTTQQQGGSTPASDTVEAASPASAVTNSEVFTFRDIFEPLAGAVAPDVTPTEDTTDTVDTTEYAADTLYLIAIGTEGDVPYASLVWNSQTFTLNEGDSIPNTPWKVLDIRTSDVVMLYGDQQVVLSVGQGISK